MPLYTEARAVFDEMPSGDGVTRPSIIQQYARKVAAQSLSVYPSDDETATTRAWLVTIGGTDADPSVFTGPDSSSLGIADATFVPTLSKGGQTVVIGAKTTRGAVRRFLTAIGVTYTGVQSPA